MQSLKSEAARDQRNFDNSRSLPDSRLMNDSSIVATSSMQSHLFPVAASPPKAVLNLRHHTFISPNSSFARAVVMGNQESVARSAGYNVTQTRSKTSGNPVSNFESHSISTTMTPRSANLLASQRQQDQDHNQPKSHSKKPISNLPALLNASYYNNNTEHVSEADSASGPPPPPSSSPSNVQLLGQSAPNFYTHSFGRRRPEQSPPSTQQLTRPFQLSNAAEQLSTDKVRR